MALEKTQQLEKILEDKKHVLVCFENNGDIDSMSSALALKNFLEKQSKIVDIVSGGIKLQKNINFLKNSEKIKDKLTNLQKFIIKVDVSNVKLDTLTYDIKDNFLQIQLTPREGSITKDQLRTAQTSYRYDLIITLNTNDLDSLGEIFFNNTDLFYSTPILNIGHSTENESYGQINLIEPAKTAVSEIILESLKNLNKNYIDAETATCLLTGMIFKTNSFKNSNVSPNTLNIASELINFGADREKIIKHLYQTRTVSTLKLWGQALSHLNYEQSIGLIYSSLTTDDFTRSGASNEDLKEVIGEIISTAPEAKIILVLYEYVKENAEKEIHAILHTNYTVNAKDIIKTYHCTGDKKQATFIVKNKTLKQAEEEIIQEIKNQLK